MTISDVATARLKTALGGRLIRSTDPEYEAARTIWNAMVVKRPAVIAECESADDVARCIEFARAQGLEASVRGAGHNVAGLSLCDDGIVIDLSRMRSIQVDRSTRRILAQPGALLGDLDRAGEQHGLVVPAGVVSHTGVGGLTLGGGIGHLSRRWGLTIDSLRGADVVTADGAFLRASESENADLFWGLRGGGGNFGVVTSFAFEGNPWFDPVCSYASHAGTATRDVLRYFRDAAERLPDEVACHVLLQTVDGRRSVSLIAMYFAPPAGAEPLLRPFAEFGHPSQLIFQQIPFTSVQSVMDDPQAHGSHNYWKSHYFAELSDGAIEAIARHFEVVTSPNTVINIVLLGGAMARVPSGATAFAHRHAKYTVEVFTRWPPSDAARQQVHIEWTRRLWKDLRAFASGGMSVNHMDNDEQDRVRNAYGKLYEKLVDVKTKYDPTNFFHRNHNVVPRQVERGPTPGDV